MTNPMSNRVSSSASISNPCWWKRRELRFAPLFLLALSGCANLEQIAPTITSSLGADSATLAEGRRIYTQGCTSCHAAEPISAYTSAQWRTILPDMIQRTKLTPTQGRAVETYVWAALRLPKTASVSRSTP